TLLVWSTRPCGPVTSPTLGDGWTSTQTAGRNCIASWAPQWTVHDHAQSKRDIFSLKLTVHEHLRLPFTVKPSPASSVQTSSARPTGARVEQIRTKVG